MDRPVQFPPEIFVIIFENLCHHCQYPDEFPNADTVETIESKATLARLCRVSKQFKVLAEPILYHYYATGNMDFCAQDKSKNSTYRQPCRKRNKPEYDYLPEFIRTLRARPMLKYHVRSLQLVDGTDHSGVFSRYSRLFRRDVGIVKGWHKYNNEVLEHNTFEMSKDLPGFLTHYYLEDVLITMTLNLEMVMFARTIWFAEPLNYPDFPGYKNTKLPRLHTMALLESKNYQPQCRWNDEDWSPETVSLLLFNAASNLGTVYYLLSDHEILGSCDVEVNLTKLFWTGHRPDLDDDHATEGPYEMENLVELEVYYSPEQPNQFCTHIISLEYSKDTLEKFTCTVDEVFELNKDYSNVLNSEPLAMGYLKDFPRLRELSVYQRAFQHPLDKVAEGQLVKLLPPNIENLEIGKIYRGGMKDHFEQLADSRVTGKFPKLVDICIRFDINDSDNSDELRDEIDDIMETMQPRFKDVGINLHMVPPTKWSDLRTLVPGVARTEGQRNKRCLCRPRRLTTS